MGFECPNYSEGFCTRQEGACTPTRGNCVLSGRFKIFDPSELIENKTASTNNPAELTDPISITENKRDDENTAPSHHH